MNWLVLHASPRSGNSARAGMLLAAALTASGADATLLALRDCRVAPCTACGLCAHQPGICSLDPEFFGSSDDSDNAASLFARLWAADGVIVIAPVYFYGLPAQLKALVDRAQRYWAAGFPEPPLRPAFAVFPAAREQGERLFDGSLLTLRPFLRLLGFQLREHLELRGLDTADALEKSPERQALVSAWGRNLAQVQKSAWPQKLVERVGA